jgi:hypothetical protein
VASSRPGANGWEHTLAGSLETRAAPLRPAPLWETASSNAANVTESTAVPICVVVRPGHTLWIRTLVAPSSADVGCLPPCGWTVSSVSERTVV